MMGVDVWQTQRVIVKFSSHKRCRKC